MLKQRELYAPFTERAVVRPGGEVFLSGDDAQRFVVACESAGLAIAGIEGVRFEGEKIKPYIDVIADYFPRKVQEWNTYQEQCNRLALDFLHNAVKEKGVDTCFCFEVLEPAGYADCLKRIAFIR
ncbi:hypothetical protein [Paraburkholderia sp.]|jgi:hypothetical protein|uniref:hypothetical protein n=1 Tax=Paraburkholderia sp. TaxID=1926495 RepID=UPI002F4269C2